VHTGKDLEAHWVEKGRSSCDSGTPQVGSARSYWTRVVKVNRRKTNRRKTRPCCICTAKSIYGGCFRETFCATLILLVSYGCLSCCWRAGKWKRVQLVVPVPWILWQWFIGLWDRLRDHLSCVTRITVYILQSCSVLTLRPSECDTVTKAYFTN